MRTDKMPSSSGAIAASQLPWFRVPPEHGAVITFVLSLLLSVGLSSHKVLSAILCLIFFLLFASLHNNNLRISVAAIGVLAASLWQLPLTAIAFCLLALGRKLLSLFPNCSVDMKQFVALAGMAFLPLSASLIAPHDSLEILSKYALFLHATMFGAATVFFYLRNKGFRWWIPAISCIFVLLAGLPGGGSLVLTVFLLGVAKALYLITRKHTPGLKHVGILEAVYLSCVTLTLYIH